VSWSKCQRCGLCAEACPVDAISWKKGGLAEIDQDACIHCGKCEATCPPKFSAIARFAAEGDANRAAGPLYRVVMKKCSLCGFCIKYCPVNAISWKRTMTKKEAAIIDEGVCVRCGHCVVECETNNTQKVNAIDVIAEA